MITPGLEHISHLLARTPLPWRAIHVAGTNGKGSICAYISQMMEVWNRQAINHGLKPLTHGRFTSPHLVDRWDCITINQEAVSFRTFSAVEQRLLRRNEEEKIGASEFELLTAAAFEVFSEREVDVAVVEVGMGGRLDATNVIGERNASTLAVRALPLVTAISSIGLDHQAFLGDTLEEIAREKAGTIKPGVPVVYDLTNPSEVCQVIETVAKERRSPVVQPNALPGGWDAYLNEVTRCLPPHVKQNATVAFTAAWTALQQLDGSSLQSKDDGRTFDNGQFSSGQLARMMLDTVPKTVFPGRQQPVSIEHPTGRSESVLLDGAHNSQSAKALANTVDKLRSATSNGMRNITWVIAASDTKDAKEILSPLLKDGDSVFGVEFGPVDGMPWVRPLSTERLLEAAKAVVTTPEALSVHDCGGSVLGALTMASERAKGGPMVIAGSLYLVGDVLRVLRDG